MDDDNSLTAKILTQLEEVIFSNRVEIRQFTIIPAEHELNKSPVVVAEDCVALESWCVKHIFKTIYDDLLNCRQSFLARRLTDKQLRTVNRFLTGALLINPNIVTFWNMKRQLVEMGRVAVTDELHFSKLALTSAPKSNEIFSYRRWLLSRILERKRPEKRVSRQRGTVEMEEERFSHSSSQINGATNSRKSNSNFEEESHQDLKQSSSSQNLDANLSMDSHEPSKSNGASSNEDPIRNELEDDEPMIIDCPLNIDISENENNMAMPSEMNGSYFDLLLSELLINEYVVKKVPNNYHAFNHRIWLIEKILPLLGGQLTAKALDLEFKYSTQWISTNISHHTGYAYRQFLIKTTKSIKSPLKIYQDFMRDFLKDNLDLPKSNYVSCLLYDLYRLTTDLAIFRNENESLWYHRRFLLYSLIDFIRSYYETKPSKLKEGIGMEEGLKEAKVFKTDLETCDLYKLVKDKEVDFVKENLSSSSSAVQKYWTERHCKWLQNVLKVNWI